MNLEFSWSSTLVHYVLSRQLYCKKRHELWFLIEKQPARFSIFEFQDITGLNCEPLPNTMIVEDVEKSNSFWALFNLRRTRSTPSAEDICTLCQSPDVCRFWSREDQIRLCYLAILTGGLLALDRREAISPAKAKLLMDLKIFEQNPWGRVAFIELVQQIKDATAKKIKENSSYVCKGSDGPCLVGFNGKCGKLALSAILEQEKVTCMCERSLDEVHPVWEDPGEDPEIDNLMEFLRQDNSLSTITWQALPEYPLTPIECNNRSLVASQRKSKKAKKVARNGQENIADVGEKRGDIFLQLLSAKVEGLEKQLNSEPVSALFQSAVANTVDNLASRITQLEEIMLLEKPANDRFSYTKLPAKPAKTEGSKGMTTVQGTYGPQDPGQGDKEEGKQGTDGPQDPEKEGDKEEVKQVREDHPDNPEEKNTIEDIEEEHPFEGQGINAGRSSYSTRTLFPFFSCRDSVYPIGSETRALNFFTVFMKPRAWLTDEVGDLTFDTYLGVPQAKSPYGDCGVYALKFLECLMLGVPFSRYYLKDTRMEQVRKNLAAAMYVETAGANESMHDPKFLAIAIDEATKDREERN
ncbi:hypothetical protein IGI04_019365 [Brassica rapa subsp. trilocularis]|uniref:Ubiquitin-like protease family profile domain-containing protein n=1 Tax=Brassica rapa subsp. trilocularis TaxID=1813537 RepID=A0ABQ7MJ26_BRACM|nr:hypothetical protein IGI04_019365 [Brassica rapa subsp. trilocularis]